MTQIAAETLGLAVGQVKVELADTAFPQAAVAGGSQTSASVGPAVQAACRKVVASARERATADPKSPLFQKNAQEIEAGEGRLFLKNQPNVGETIVSLLQRNGGRPIEASSESGPPAAAQGGAGGKPPEEFSKHAWGAQFAEVRIDQRLGQIRVSRMVGAFAAGRILNAKTARSQIMGGMVWGISAALLEHTIYDPNRAKVVNDSLADYLVAVNPDIPPIDCFFVEEKDEHVNPLGVKGIGELGITGAMAAVANAVYHATGKRCRDLPITLENAGML
jgi:xanthine dehydrogenase YagR molybdenum-binding subunit